MKKLPSLVIKLRSNLLWEPQGPIGLCDIFHLHLHLLHLHLHLLHLLDHP